MEKFNLNDMVKGWFIGDFTPTVKTTKDFEFAIKYYNGGDYEERHHHKISTEYTIIIDGIVKMNEIQYSKGDIIVVEPNESTDFKCLTNVVTAVVKIPSTKNDKYIDT